MSFLRDMPEAGLKHVLRREPELGTLYATYHQVLMRGASPFSEGERELIGAYVSGLNACAFCYGEHVGIAEAFGIEAGLIDSLMENLDSAPIEEKMRVVLRYVHKLNQDPGKMVQADADKVYQAGWDEQALYHACAICGLFNMNNRLVNGLGIPGQSREDLAVNIKRLVDGGYNTTVDYINAQ